MTINEIWWHAMITVVFISSQDVLHSGINSEQMTDIAEPGLDLVFLALFTSQPLLSTPATIAKADTRAMW